MTDAPNAGTLPDRRLRRELLLIGALLALIVAVYALQGSAYATRMLVEASAYAIIAVGLNIQWGYAGLFNVGIMGFIVAGAAASVLMTFPVNPAFWAGTGASLLGEALLWLIGAVAIVALARRLTRILYAMWRDGTEYRPGAIRPRVA